MNTCRRNFNIKEYEDYVEKFKMISNNTITPLGVRDLVKYNLPTSNWFIKHCPNKEVSSWSDFVMWCGFMPKGRDKVNIKNKEIIKSKLIELENKLGRPIRQRDIKISTVGFSHYVITELWGNFQQCRDEIGLQKSIQHPVKSWAYYDSQMKIALNNIYNKLSTKSFSWKDFSLYKDVELSKDGFLDCCKREGIDPVEYFKEQGFELIFRNGSGRKYRYEDGELCVSNLEHIFSDFLRANHIQYTRNVLYNTFDSNYIGTKYNCDYVIKDMYWIEICGMTKADRDNWKTIQCNSKLEKKYNYKMIKKEESLLANNIPYLFLFKKDFDDGTFKEKTRSLIEQTE